MNELRSLNKSRDGKDLELDVAWLVITFWLFRWLSINFDRHSPSSPAQPSEFSIRNQRSPPRNPISEQASHIAI